MGDYVPPFNGDPDDPLAPFVNANPGAGLEGSIPDALMWELWQHECLNVIKAPTGPSITPSKTNRTQLLEAILRLIQAAFTAPGSASLLNSDLLHIMAIKPLNGAVRSLSDDYLAWHFNTVVTNQIAGSSLNISNTSSKGYISLPVGRYRIRTIAGASNAGHHNLRIFNRTTGTTIVKGTSGDSYPSGGGAVCNPSYAETRFTLSVPSIISIDHRGSNEMPYGSFGEADAPESYDATVWIELEKGLA